jgi:hypothetical protein
MPLSQKDIDELRAIHKKQYGEDIPNDEAWEMGIRLLNLFRLLLTERKKHTPPPTETGVSSNKS